MASKVHIRWQSHPELSAAHAAYVVASQSGCTDSKAEQLLIDPVTNVNNRLLSSSMDVGEFWRTYLLQVLLGNEQEQACATALATAGCSELQLDQTCKSILGQLKDARGLFMRRFPKLTEQLELRSRPLKDKWDTFGPGLLRDVGRQIWDQNPPSDWWRSPVTGYLVQPMRGGDGGYDSSSGRFWIEAMLTDVDMQVPEVLRAAWLITRMSIESYTREKSGEVTLAMPWRLVAIPLVLTAAQNLEILRGPELPIARAMQLWEHSDSRLAETIGQWWSEHRRNRTPLPAALKVLHAKIRAQQPVSDEGAWDEFQP